MQILVTGGTGFLGQHLAQALLALGHDVRVLGRNLAVARALAALGATPILGDLRDRTGIIAACRRADAVYHAGALSEPWGKSADFLATNVGGTANVLAGCHKYGVQRLIYVSSPSVLFDGRNQYLLTDDAPYPRRFASTYSWSKKLGEDLVNASTQLETVILRPKAVFGPGDQALLPRLLQVAKLGRLPQIGDGRNRVDLTYVENVVDALVVALDAPRAVGKTYTITNDEHVLLWDVIRAVLQAHGLPTRLRQIPVSVALAAATAMEVRAAQTKVEPLLTRYTAGILGRTQTYDISAAKRDLGYAPRISVAEGVRRTLLFTATEPS